MRRHRCIRRSFSPFCAGIALEYRRNVEILPPNALEYRRNAEILPPAALEYRRNAEILPPGALEYCRNVEILPPGALEYRRNVEILPLSGLPGTLVAETCLQGSISCFWRAAPKRRFQIKNLLKLSLFGLSASRDRFGSSPG